MRKWASGVIPLSAADRFTRTMAEPSTIRFACTLYVVDSAWNLREGTAHAPRCAGKQAFAPNAPARPRISVTAHRIYSSVMSEITHLMDAAASGDRQAAADLLPLVYDELRKLAAARMAAEKPGHTLDATALVHEAYLRLVGDQQFDGRGHFFAAAAEAMRRILVNHARDRKRLKRAGGRVRLELLDQVGCSLAEDPDLVLSLDELLNHLAEEDAVAARVAQLHLFGGLSVQEAGEASGLSRTVAYRNWKYARAWLRDALEE